MGHPDASTSSRILRRSLLLLAVLWTPIVARAEGPPETGGIIAVVAVDQRSRIRGIEANAKLLDGLFETLRGCGIPLTVERIDPDRVSPGEIVARIRALDANLARTRTLLFYYAGHGATEPRRGHFLSTSGGPLFRSALRAEILAKDPPLALILTDSCSVEVTWTVPFGFTPLIPPPTERVLRNLFLQHRGLVDINASTYRAEEGIDQVACYSDIPGPTHGGIFTNSLIEMLGVEPMAVAGEADAPALHHHDLDRDSFLTWDEAFDCLRTKTATNYAHFREMLLPLDPAGGPMMRVVRPEDLRRISAQPSQDPQAFGALAVRSDGPPPTAPEATEPGRPRLGVTMRTLPGVGGVEIREVVPGSPASRVRVIQIGRAHV